MAAPTKRPLIGRQQPFTFLQLQHDTLTHGDVRIVLLGGEPGIGKTRLLSEFAAWGEQCQSTVLYGSASDAEGMPPYLPFLETVGTYLRSNVDRILSNLPLADASILAHLFSELHGYVKQSLPVEMLPLEQSRLRLYQSIVSLLAAICEDAPLILEFDDLQWADRATFDLLCYIAQHSKSLRLLVVGAYRPGDAEANPGFKRALADLNRLRTLTNIELVPLLQSDIAAVVENLLGGAAQSSVHKLLYDQSEGNPFFVEELLYDWRNSGALIATDQEWVLAVEQETLSLPSTIIVAVQQRLEHIAPAVVETLRFASVIGRRFSLSILAQAMGLEPDVVEVHLLEACGAQLLNAQFDDEYSFSHDKIRECLLSSIPPLKLKRMHGAVGRVLENSPEGRTDRKTQRLSQLAFHFSSSGDPERGAAYAQQAGEKALANFAFEAALKHFRTALALSGTRDAHYGKLFMLCGEAAVLAGKEADAVTAFTSALAWYQDIERDDRPQTALAAYQLGRAQWRMEAQQDARMAFELALQILDYAPLPETVAVLVDLGTLLAVSLLRHTDGFERVEQALMIAQRLEDDLLVAKVRRAQGNLLVRANRLDEGIVLLESALALVTKLDDLVEAVECCACLTMACFWKSDFRHGYVILQRQLDYAKRCHDPFQLRHVYANLSMMFFVTGNPDKAMQALEQAQSVVDGLNNPEAQAFVKLGSGMMAYYQSDFATAEAIMQQGIATLRAIGPRAAVWWQGLLGLAQIMQGKTREALSNVIDLEMLLETLPVGSMPTSEPLCHLTMIALALPDDERLKRYEPRLRAFSGQLHDALVDRLLGMIATRQREWVVAREFLAAAEATARQQNLKMELVDTLLAQAELIMEQAGKLGAEARSLVEQANILADQIGYGLGKSRCVKLLAQVYAEQPAGLTAREIDVLRLVAAGKSNRQIAQALFISKKTVEKHLSSIFGKTGSDNRAGATAFAFQHQIVSNLPQ